MKPRPLLCLLAMLVAICGCATADSKQDREMQTAADVQYIVLPIFILSAPQDGSPGGGNVLPAPNSPNHAGRRGESVPIEM